MPKESIEPKDFFDYADDGCDLFKQSFCVVFLPFVAFFALIGFVREKITKWRIK
jgi:hypothetical protein